MEAYKKLTEAGRRVRLVSMPNTGLFDAQDEAYRESVLPKAVTRRVAVEAGITSFWRKYVGLQGAVVGIDRFGESAPAEALFEHFGFTAARVTETVLSLLK
jgi:transketolase